MQIIQAHIQQHDTEHTQHSQSHTTTITRSIKSCRDHATLFIQACTPF